MILADAEKLARELMAEFGLTPGWLFQFDNGKRRFGSCLHSTGGWRSIQLLGTAKGRITLSRELTLLNDRTEVEDTIRHEIAHALAGHKAGHGPEWKAVCLHTGAKPVRCYTHDNVNAPKGDWQATCRVCGRLYTKFRRPKRDLWCGDKECRKTLLPYIPGAGRFHPERKLEYRHKNALPEATPNTEQRRKAVEAMKAQLMKAQLKSAEQEPGVELIYQCAKCDRKSISFHSVCPVCNGDMMLESKLRAEKEELKRRIAELETKLGVKK